MKQVTQVFERAAEAGVPPAMAASEAKHVRFCNLTALAGAVCAVVFWVLEVPVITDWGRSTAQETGILVARGLGALLFLVPLWLNVRQQHAAARLVLVLLALAYVGSSSLIFAAAAPSHLFILVIAAAVLAMFPDRERPLMIALVGLCGLVFGGMLWLRWRDEPLVRVQREEVRLAMEVFISFGALILALVVTRVLRGTARRAELQALHEHERADRLLLNILPESIARRLKEDPSTIADGFHDVTVLFADLVGFTPMTEKMAPGDTLKLMDEVFSKFDDLVERFGLEKIKTVGDAYMLAGGLPETSETHAEDVAGMALAMLDEVRQIRGPDGVPLSIRIGIATGPVVAGVIGRKKFLYDLWGDTVNTASRMEAFADADTIQVSETTWRRLRGRFQFRERGAIEIKGKGRVATWFLEGRAAGD